mmetsp:Transcript_44812/g.130519  ORF Transcript_44812/g.130519 Transcript_44812/m.130519 type:complete len:209 (+) Transcript_44812:914-1540(+)
MLGLAQRCENIDMHTMRLSVPPSADGHCTLPYSSIFFTHSSRSFSASRMCRWSSGYFGIRPRWQRVPHQTRFIRGPPSALMARTFDSSMCATGAKPFESAGIMAGTSHVKNSVRWWGVSSMDRYASTTAPKFFITILLMDSAMSSCGRGRSRMAAVSRQPMYVSFPSASTTSCGAAGVEEVQHHMGAQPRGGRKAKVGARGRPSAHQN